MNKTNVSAVAEREQMKDLFSELEQLEASLKACRGKLGIPLIETFDTWMGQEKRVQDVMNSWDKFLPKTADMLCLLARLRRDNRPFAFEQLKNALTTPGYIMEGEIFSPYLTRPVTVLMFDPVRTWEMIWVIARTTKRYYKGERRKELYKLFPPFRNLRRKYYRNRNGADQGKEYGESYEITMRGIIGNGTLRKIEKRSKKLELNNNQRSSFPNNNVTFAYLFDGMSSREVLNLLPRKLKKAVSIWSFKVPRIISCFKIGLHDYSYADAEKWSEKFPSLIPHEISFSGYSGIILPIVKGVNSPYYTPRFERIGRGWGDEIQHFRNHSDSGFIFTTEEAEIENRQLMHHRY